VQFAGVTLPTSPAIQATPEPSAVVLLSAAAVGWVACRFRRGRRARTMEMVGAAV
jgi:hypothetical protein